MPDRHEWEYQKWEERMHMAGLKGWAVWRCRACADLCFTQGRYPTPEEEAEMQEADCATLSVRRVLES